MTERPTDAYYLRKSREDALRRLLKDDEGATHLRALLMSVSF